MEDEIIVIDRIEEAEDKNGKTYLKITDKAGVTRNFKEGRAKLLTNKGHLLEEGKAIKLHFEDYKAPSGQVFPFVKDFEVVKDVFVAQATEKVQAQVKVDKNDSIEAQVAFKGMVELIATGMIKTNGEEYKATLAWAMERIDISNVIVTKIEEAKDETSKDNPETTDRQQGKEQASGQDSGDALEVLPEKMTAGELFSWIISKDKTITTPRVWLEAEYKVSHGEVLTIKKCHELYTQIKKDKGW